MEAKLQSLLAILSQQSGLDIDKVRDAVFLLHRALAQLKELRDWKQSLEERNGIF